MQQCYAYNIVFVIFKIVKVFWKLGRKEARYLACMFLFQKLLYSVIVQQIDLCDQLWFTALQEDIIIASEEVVKNVDGGYMDDTSLVRQSLWMKIFSSNFLGASKNFINTESILK